jgi:hypothetical protein
MEEEEDVELGDEGGSFFCTGFFFKAPGRALTANHCLPTDSKVYAEIANNLFPRYFYVCVRLDLRPGLCATP